MRFDSPRWTDDLQFYVLFSSISVISTRFEGDSKSLCVHRMCENFRNFTGDISDIFNTFDVIFLVFTEKKVNFIFIFFISEE